MSKERLFKETCEYCFKVIPLGKEFGMETYTQKVKPWAQNNDLAGGEPCGGPYHEKCAVEFSKLVQARK